MLKLRWIVLVGLIGILLVSQTGCLGGLVTVEETPTVEVTDEATAETTQEPTEEPTARPTATAEPTPTATTPSLEDWMAIEPAPSSSPEPEGLHTDWFTATVEGEVETIKQNPSGCNMPDEVCYIVDEEGVLGADSYDEAQANDSAVWTGGANHQTADQETVGVLIPEGSYVTAYASGMRIVGGGYDLLLPECGEHCAWGFLARGWFAETHADRHVPVQITNLGAIGGMKYTRYPVPVEAGQFFSEDYLTDQASNALQFDNCGAGPDDCDIFLQAVFDYNDGSLSILSFTEEGWELLWTNVVQQ